MLTVISKGRCCFSINIIILPFQCPSSKFGLAVSLSSISWWTLKPVRVALSVVKREWFVFVASIHDYPNILRLWELERSPATPSQTYILQHILNKWTCPDSRLDLNSPSVTYKRLELSLEMRLFIQRQILAVETWETLCCFIHCFDPSEVPISWLISGGLTSLRRAPCANGRHPGPMMRRARPRMHARSWITQSVSQVANLHQLKVLSEVRHCHPAGERS